MGLFVLDLENPQTRKSMITAAIANLNLYLEELESGSHHDHLLSFANDYLTQAINDNGLSKYDNLTRDDII